ncbi:MAG: ribosome-associated translation inhibitor RaiA [Opitutales bacterium]|nr:ribosome-associated translation inhibitor RaiA [Opitutales bacterium]
MNDRTNDIIISGHNMELTAALKSTVREKVSRLFDHEQHIIRMRIELDAVQKTHNEHEFAAKGHIEIKGKPLVANDSSEDLYKSIDGMVQKLDRMLRRRSRLRVLKRKQTHEVDIPAQLPKVVNAR